MGSSSTFTVWIPRVSGFNKLCSTIGTNFFHVTSFGDEFSKGDNERWGTHLFDDLSMDSSGSKAGEHNCPPFGMCYASSVKCRPWCLTRWFKWCVNKMNIGCFPSGIMIEFLTLMFSLALLNLLPTGKTPSLSVTGSSFLRLLHLLIARSFQMALISSWNASYWTSVSSVSLLHNRAPFCKLHLRRYLLPYAPVPSTLSVRHLPLNLHIEYLANLSVPSKEMLNVFFLM